MRASSCLTVVVGALLIGGCTKTSDEDLIRAKLNAALEGVNARRPGAVVADVAEDFEGPRKIGRRETRRRITGYMLGAGWVRAFARKTTVEVRAHTAHVDLEVIVARGRAVESLEDVLPTNSSILDFDLELEKRDEGWTFTKGAYRQMRW